MEDRQLILTGDRPTGPLHLGHYVGSLLNRVELQKRHDQFIVIADLQALTDNVDEPQRIRQSVFEVLLDYLSVGIDPTMSTIFVQSMIPEIAELAIIFLNLVSVNRLKRNPTVKTEIAQKGLEQSLCAGFLIYPVHQAADIAIVKGTLVPVGNDQLPMLEQANELFKDFNRMYGTVFPPAIALTAPVSRLMGIDGKNKMGKSLGNAIFLSDQPDIVAQKVMAMYTDPDHLRVSDPGKVEGNMVFHYLDAFDADVRAVQELKEHYRRGGLGDVAIKKRLIVVLNDLLDPIRRRRADFSHDRAELVRILQSGIERVRSIAKATMDEVRSAMGLVYY